MNPLFKKYHSFEEWLTLTSSDRQQWYKLQTIKNTRSNLSTIENEMELIERTQREQTERNSNHELFQEINF